MTRTWAGYIAKETGVQLALVMEMVLIFACMLELIEHVFSIPLDTTSHCHLFSKCGQCNSKSHVSLHLTNREYGYEITSRYVAGLNIR